MQRQNLGIDTPLRQRGLHPRDLALSGQEHQQIAGVHGQRVFDRTPRLRFQRFFATRREVRHADGVCTARAGQPWRIEELRQALAI